MYESKLKVLFTGGLFRHQSACAPSASEALSCLGMVTRLAGGVWLELRSECGSCVSPAVNSTMCTFFPTLVAHVLKRTCVSSVTVPFMVEVVARSQPKCNVGSSR